ncbi:MAG: SRPBCC family protein [Chloroflexota bacterium]
MITFDLSTLVDRPMPEVFTFLSNPLNLPKWQMMIANIEQVTPGAPGVGSKYKVAAEIMGRKIDGLMELTTLEPPTRFGFTNQAGPMQVTVTVSLKPAGTGTHITLNAQGNPGGVFKIAESLLAGQVKTQMESNLARLKTLLESGG